MLIALDSELGLAAQLADRASSNALAGPSGRVAGGQSSAVASAPLGSGGFDQPRSRDVLAALGALEALLSPQQSQLYGASNLSSRLLHACVCVCQC